jgi:6,7-dimethyl-8-ribityllumazine synthase
MSDTHDERAQAEAGITTPMTPVEPPFEQATEVADPEAPFSEQPPPAEEEEEELSEEPSEELADERSEELADERSEEPSEEPSEELSEDPFAAWPQAESAEVIEDVPEPGESVHHVAGEIDVPDGYAVLEGTPSGLRRSVAVVVSRYNGGVTNRMLAVAIETLEEAGVASEAVTIMPVPGAFELPLAAMALAKTRRYACVVALGAVVRGETPHFDYVAGEAASGLQLAAIETGVPVAFGVLTVDTAEQAEARIDRAADAVRTALEMADVFAQLRASARN